MHRPYRTDAVRYHHNRPQSIDSDPRRSSSFDFVGLFSKGDPKTIPGRAFVVPHDVGNVYGNVNELAVNAKVLTHVRLEISSTTDNRPEYREVARRFWLETEAPLAPIRVVKQLPRVAIREGKELLSTWRKALGDFKDELQADSATGTDGRPAPPKGPAWNEKEVEQARRTAVTLRYRLEKHPQEHAKLRASTLTAAPSQAEQVIAGYRHPLDFEHWLMYQEVSGVISTDEANDYRRQAGLL